jgi:hypothetical protein
MNWEIDKEFCHSAISNNANEADIKRAVLAAADYAFNVLFVRLEFF